MTINQFNTPSTTTIPSKVHVNAQTILIARHYLLAVPQEVDPETDKATQKVVRPYEVERLVGLASGAELN